MDATLLPALQDVLMVARTGSVGRAAARLHKTPSAVSQQVRRIEAHFGVELFERAGRGVRLGPQGEAALSAINGLFDNAESVFELLSSLSGEPATTVRIATSDYLGNALLVPVVRNLIAEGAPLRFEIVSSNSFESKKLVLRGEVDLAVITRAGASSLMERELFVQPFFWVAPRAKESVLALPERLRALLTTEPLLRLSPGSQGRRLLDVVVDRLGLRPLSTIDLSGVNLLVSYVLGGIGVGIAPGLALVNATRRRIVVDRADIDPLPVVLVSRPGFAATKGVERFVERLVSESSRIERHMKEVLDPLTKPKARKAPRQRRRRDPREATRRPLARV